jgi:hypothetical protein
MITQDGKQHLLTELGKVISDSRDTSLVFKESDYIQTRMAQIINEMPLIESYTLRAKEVAKKLGLSPTTIKIYATKFNVGHKRGRDWEFTKEDIKILRHRSRQKRKERI